VTRPANMPARSHRELAADVGQLLIMGFDGVEMSERLSRRLSAIRPGGVILFARNIRQPLQTWQLLRDCRRHAPAPMFLCVDLEGGDVDRFRNLLGPAPAAAAVFASGDSNLFRAHGHAIGCAVRALGFNTDFAPVLDLGFPASRSVLGTRAVSADPRQAILYARHFLAGLKSAGVLGCGKHFPGLGEGRLDSHHRLPRIRKDFRRLWAEDLLPYRVLRNQLVFVMVAHAAYPTVTGDGTPASLSRKWMAEILRRKIGFRGLIVSDDLDMGGVLAAASVEDAAIHTLRAGADMFLVCQREDNAVRAFEAVLREAERDRRFAQLVRQASRRVLAVKGRRGELRRPSPPPQVRSVERLTRRLWELGERVRLESLAPGDAG
jgi:beta-N-acetylhexosaminidase